MNIHICPSHPSRSFRPLWHNGGGFKYLGRPCYSSLGSGWGLRSCCWLFMLLGPKPFRGLACAENPVLHIWPKRFTSWEHCHLWRPCWWSTSMLIRVLAVAKPIPAITMIPLRLHPVYSHSIRRQQEAESGQLFVGLMSKRLLADPASVALQGTSFTVSLIWPFLLVPGFKRHYLHDNEVSVLPFWNLHLMEYVMPYIPPQLQV